MANRERYDVNVNNPGNIASAEAYQFITNTKVVIQNLLLNYFDSQNIDPKQRDVTIQRLMFKSQFIAKTRDKKPIYIEREFPVTNRNYPLILVSIENPKEKKLYLGWDNISNFREVTIDGTRLGEMTEAQHWEMTVNIEVADLNIDDRDQLVSFLAYGFQAYFRSNYLWQHPDGKSYFCLNTGHEEVVMNLNPTPKTDTSGGEIYPVYFGGIKIPVFLEHYYLITSREYINNLRIKLPGDVFPIENGIAP